MSWITPIRVCRPPEPDGTEATMAGPWTLSGDRRRPHAYIDDVAVPVPGRGDVLVKVETSGLCHTDIHVAHGDWPITPTLPFIPGHEGVGVVERVGVD
jgi:D-arabinose 1-dehydrogenase-like Zn-dependent alcohol dehydrogenase